MRQERLKVGVRGPSVLLAEVPNLVCICPVDCCNVDRGNRPSSTCVRIRNVSAADQPDVDSHELPGTTAARHAPAGSREVRRGVPTVDMGVLPLRL